MFILVLLSGDVEPNPGQDSVVGNINSSHNGSLEMLTNHLSMRGWTGEPGIRG